MFVFQDTLSLQTSRDSALNEASDARKIQRQEIPISEEDTTSNTVSRKAVFYLARSLLDSFGLD